MRYLQLLVLITCIAGCGKYDRPVPPEAAAPSAVGGFSVSANDKGVILAWSSPKEDRRGQELYRPGSFRVERKQLERYTGLLDATTGFEVLSQLQDKSATERARLEDEALANGKPVSRVKLDSELTKFSYLDTSAQFGKQYLYKVMPVNPSGDGEVNVAYRVLFRGSGSEVTMVKLPSDDEGLMEDLFTN